MCTGWKFVGVAALTFSLFYNFIVLFIAVTFVLRCYDDCNGRQTGAYPEDCYSTFAIYTLYLPTVFAAPFIVLTDRSSIYYLQWWLLLHAVLTCCSYFIYICYSPFYSAVDSDMNMAGIASLAFMLGFVAYHLFRRLRAPAADANSQCPAESTA